MPSRKLENYLKTYRKRAELSQQEMALFLGSRDSTWPGRHEAFIRTSSLATALSYEAIFGVPVRELFGGAYERAEYQTARRARVLRGRSAATRDCSTAMRRMLERLDPETNHQPPKA